MGEWESVGTPEVIGRVSLLRAEGRAHIDGCGPSYVPRGRGSRPTFPLYSIPLYLYLYGLAYVVAQGVPYVL